MAESMKGLHRTHRCTEVSSSEIGQQVTVMGWVQKRRNLGSLIFIDLRDRSGLLQIVFDEPKVGSEGFAKAGSLRSEYVVAVTGTVEKRAAAVNESLKTGEIEVIASDIRILSEAETPPFPIEENSQTKEDLRLRYRFLDLRRPDIQRNMMMKSKVSMLLRNFMEQEGFLEIETPMLTKSTPEGARDYLVPSRVHPGTASLNTYWSSRSLTSSTSSTSTKAISMSAWVNSGWRSARKSSSRKHLAIWKYLS